MIVRRYDRDTTNPINLEEQFKFARGTRSAVKLPMSPALVTGDWLISPDGVEGYIAGRSLDTPGNWIFVIKTGRSGWDSVVVEMTADSFIGFKHKEKEKLCDEYV